MVDPNWPFSIHVALKFSPHAFPITFLGLCESNTTPLRDEYIVNMIAHKLDQITLYTKILYIFKIHLKLPLSYSN
jgi:hypothetical protein